MLMLIVPKDWCWLSQRIDGWCWLSQRIDGLLHGVCLGSHVGDLLEKLTWWAADAPEVVKSDDWPKVPLSTKPAIGVDGGGCCLLHWKWLGSQSVGVGHWDASWCCCCNLTFASSGVSHSSAKLWLVSSSKSLHSQAELHWEMLLHLSGSITPSEFGMVVRQSSKMVLMWSVALSTNMDPPWNMSEWFVAPRDEQGLPRWVDWWWLDETHWPAKRSLFANSNSLSGLAAIRVAINFKLFLKVWALFVGRLACGWQGVSMTWVGITPKPSQPEVLGLIGIFPVTERSLKLQGWCPIPQLPSVVLIPWGNHRWLPEPKERTKQAWALKVILVLSSVTTASSQIPSPLMEHPAAMPSATEPLKDEAQQSHSCEMQKS